MKMVLHQSEIEVDPAILKALAGAAAGGTAGYLFSPKRNKLLGTVGGAGAGAVGGYLLQDLLERQEQLRRDNSFTGKYGNSILWGAIGANSLRNWWKARTAAKAVAAAKAISPAMASAEAGMAGAGASAAAAAPAASTAGKIARIAAKIPGARSLGYLRPLLKLPGFTIGSLGLGSQLPSYLKDGKVDYDAIAAARAKAASRPWNTFFNGL